MSEPPQDRFESLHELVRRLAEDFQPTALGDALDAAMRSTGAVAGTAHGVGARIVAERGIGQRGEAAALRAILGAVAARAIEQRLSFAIADVGAPESGIAGGTALAAAGLPSLVAVPVEQRQAAVGVLLLLHGGGARVDPADVDLAHAIARVVALGMARDDRERSRPAARAKDDDGVLVTASIAHALRTPVGALEVQLAEQRRVLENLEHHVSVGDSAGALLHELSELRADASAAVDQLHQTITELATLGRSESPPGPVDARAIVRDAIWMARRELEKRGVLLVDEQPPEGCFVVGRRDHLTHVVLNLVMNAAEACVQVPGGDRRIDVFVEREGDNAVLRVEDTGPGVTTDALRHLFEPFHSDGRAAGANLALRVSSDVIADHGGHLEVDNRPGGGACFRVYLPLAPASMPPRASLPTLPAPADASDAPRDVLVVDDDEVFTRSMRRALRPHRVVAAATASEAEIALLQPDYAPHLVLCDIFLPGVNGDELHRRVLRLRPELGARFLFITGGALTKAQADYLRASGLPTLLKPLDLRTVLAHLGTGARQPRGIRTLAGNHT